jgi:hypothetical protein
MFKSGREDKRGRKREISLFRLVKLVARAFYDDDVNAKGANKPKPEKYDNRGIAVVVLDALTRYLLFICFSMFLFVSIVKLYFLH